MSQKRSEKGETERAKGDGSRGTERRRKRG